MRSRNKIKKVSVSRYFFKRLFPFFLLVSSLFGLALCGLNAEMGSTHSPLSSGDGEFMKKAAMGGMMEVALGKLAEEKGTTPLVKKFGKMMVRDHGEINDDMTALARRKGVMLPSSLDEKHQAKVDAMSKLSGAAFDKAYLESMSSMHEKDLAAFARERSITLDADLKAALDKALPVVKGHIEHLKSMEMFASK